MKKYNTSQRQILIDFMSKNSDKSYSIDEWILLMQKNIVDDKIPARSTIYRLMQNLVKEKIVIRSSNGKNDVKYVISHCSSQDHLHLKCLECGDLIHINDTSSKTLFDNISKKYKFVINCTDTMLYGKCINCTQGDFNE